MGTSPLLGARGLVFEPAALDGLVVAGRAPGRPFVVLERAALDGVVAALFERVYWFHLSAVTLPRRSFFARTLVTSAGVFASKISACLFVISPWLRRAEKLLPNRPIRLKNLFIAGPVPGRGDS